MSASQIADPAYAALADSKPFPLWLDGCDAPDVHPPLAGDTSADLAIVGGGFTGLWTALIAKERNPDRDVVVLERASCPGDASGRNGGFMLGSFVDWFDYPRFEGQEKQLTEVARLNRAEFEQALERHGIDCDWEPTGWVIAARQPWEVEELEEIQAIGERAGMASTLWDQAQVREALHAPEFLAGLYQPEAVALLHPGKLSWGLKRACERAGVRFFEGTPATSLARAPQGVTIAAPFGSVTARQAVLATYARSSLIRRLNWWRFPLYSHVLATEPLTGEQLAAIGWEGRQGFIDNTVRYYYYRLTKDNRIIWGFTPGTPHGRGVNPDYEQDESVFARMARDFFARFPQLAGLRFTHRWGCAVDNTSRRAPLFGTALGGNVAYALGYSAGVGGSRGGATIVLDLLAGKSSAYTELPMVTGRGIHGRPALRPFPPDALLVLGMRLAGRAIDKQERTGRQHWFIKAMNRIGYII